MTEEKKISIVLVEDNPNDEELIMRTLTKHNLANKVQVMRDGTEILDYLYGNGTQSSQDIDNRLKLIILDLKLPKINGLEVLRRLKSDERTKTIPVVILTSSQEERDLIECYKLGVNSYLSKPVKFDDFVKVVSELGLYWLIMNKVAPPPPPDK